MGSLLLPRPFLLRLVILTLLVIAMAYVVFTYISPCHVTGVYIIILFFFLVTLTFHVYLLKSYRSSPGKFTVRYLGASGVKMFIYMISAGVLVLLNREEALQLLISFFVLYLIFTIFEIREILVHLKRNHNNP